MVRVAVTLTDRAGGLYASDHGPGGFEAVELMAVAPTYHTRTISSTCTSAGREAGSTDTIGGAGGGGGGCDPNRRCRRLWYGQARRRGALQRSD